MTEKNSSQQDVSTEAMDDIETIRQEVWELADEIFESGRYPTRNDICKGLGRSSKTLGGHFAEWRKANPRSALTVQKQSEVDRQVANGNGSGSAATDPDLERCDREIQLDVARRLIARSYYEKTKNFTVPGLADQVEEALDEIDEFSRGQDETLSPLGMVDWLKARR